MKSRLFEACNYQVKVFDCYHFDLRTQDAVYSFVKVLLRVSEQEFADNSLIECS